MDLQCIDFFRTENEVKLWTQEDGSVLFCEPFSEADSSETMCSTEGNEIGEAVVEVNSKSSRIKPSNFAPEKGSTSLPSSASHVGGNGPADSISGKTQKTYSGELLHSARVWGLNQISVVWDLGHYVGTSHPEGARV
jgi:hypothetical protein